MIFPIFMDVALYVANVVSSSPSPTLPSSFTHLALGIYPQNGALYTALVVDAPIHSIGTWRHWNQFL